tara:strand:+ start:1302 stop:1517 length:216 start_codon:yes stop_codon:yes gene_type:complete
MKLKNIKKKVEKKKATRKIKIDLSKASDSVVRTAVKRADYTLERAQKENASNGIIVARIKKIRSELRQLGS